MTRKAITIAALVGSLLVGGCESAERSGDDREPERCQGVELSEVRGTPPSYAGSSLQEYPTASTVCAAYWLDHVDEWFVPQGLAIRGTTAYVSGYRWHEERSQRPCQLLVVDLATGKTRSFQERWAAPVYRPQPTYCRHGGGLELTRHGLWVAESERLWLLDPELIGRQDPVLRVWRVQRPAEGSTLVIDGNRLGLAGFNSRRAARIHWYRLSDLIAPGVTVLETPDDHGRVPRRLQGVAATRAGIWFSSSRTACAELRAPGRRAVDFVPGAEDLQVVGDDIWTLSEAGARTYLSPGEGIVPMLLRLDRRAVLDGPRAACQF